jgi:hypothetical protein
MQDPQTGKIEVFDSQPRAVTAGTGSRVPIWRKTHTQKVDDKVEKLFESYRMVDQAVWNEKIANGERPGNINSFNERKSTSYTLPSQNVF